MTPDTIVALHFDDQAEHRLAAMMLIDEGRLALTDPVSTYIPAFAAVKVGVESQKQDGVVVLDLVPPNRPCQRRGSAAAYLGHHL